MYYLDSRLLIDFGTQFELLHMPSVMMVQRVTVYAKDREIPGVIASIPPHLLTDAERSKPMDVKNMLIDIGADSKEDAMNLGVRPGQSIIPVCPFTPMANPKKIMAKAWDNRYGCGLAIELLKELHGQEVKSHIYSGANVMEEVGLRGAAVSANMIKPDLFFALDASPANDTSGDKNPPKAIGISNNGSYCFLIPSHIKNKQIISIIG